MALMRAAVTVMERLRGLRLRIDAAAAPFTAQFHSSVAARSLASATPCLSSL